MKKILAVVLFAVLALSLAACGDAGTYKKAQEALANGSYQEALDLLETIPDFEDAENVRESAEAGILQDTAAEYLVEILENGGYYVPTSIIVLKAGYNSAENGDEYANAFGCEGIFYFTIQAQTKGGGNTSGDTVILFGGDRDKEIMTNNDPGNDYASCEASLDVKALNNAVKQYWVDMGVADGSASETV